MLKFFASFVLVVSIVREFVTLTHEVTFTIAQASSWLTNDQSQVSQLSPTPLICHVVHMYLDGLSCLVINSCKCAFTRSHMHLSFIHTLSHFVEVPRTRICSDSQTISPPSTRSTVTQNSAGTPSKSFQATLPVRKLIILHVGEPDSLIGKPP